MEALERKVRERRESCAPYLLPVLFCGVVSGCNTVGKLNEVQKETKFYVITVSIPKVASESVVEAGVQVTSLLFLVLFVFLLEFPCSVQGYSSRSSPHIKDATSADCTTKL